MILVVGASSTLGSRVIARLLERGLEVRALVGSTTVEQAVGRWAEASA